MKKSFWYDLFYLLAGIVFGGVISHVSAGAKGFSWLAYGLTFGTTTPLSVDLGIINFTLGASVNLTVATIISVVLCFAIGKFLIKR
ncbi:MAG: DUF4321 domain-containing protein [Clostridia bacterium]|nr:DUF4321 domain-containing protein [Clostridia bacterium]